MDLELDRITALAKLALQPGPEHDPRRDRVSEPDLIRCARADRNGVRIHLNSRRGLLLVADALTASGYRVELHSPPGAPGLLVTA